MMLVKIGDGEAIQSLIAKALKLNLEEPYQRYIREPKAVFEIMFAPARLVEMIGDGVELYALFLDDEQAVEFKLRYT
jgi:hypothetical protein